MRFSLKKEALVLTFITSLVICGCNNNQTEKASGNTISMPESMEVRNIYTSNTISDLKFLKLESHQDLLIADIFKMIIRGKKIHLFDFKQGVIFVFNTDGKFLFKIEEPGNGRDNKFKYLVDFEVSTYDNSIVLIDYNAFKFYYYNSKGEYVGEKKNTYFAYNLFSVDENKWIYKNGESDSPETPYVLYYTDKSFNKTGKGLLKETLPINSIISTSTPFFNYKGDIRFIHGLGNQVYSIKNQEIRNFLTLDFGENKISKSLLTSNRPREVIPAFKSGKNAGMLSKYLETDDFILLDYYRGGPDDTRGRRNALISKRDNKTVFSANLLKNKEFNFKLRWPLETHNNQFVSAINFYDIFENDYETIQNQDRMGVSIEYGWFTDWTEIMNRSQAYDSPVLVFYNFNE